MKSTLEQYIEPQHIPKRYGGQLDWDWGMMPILEPEIMRHLLWQNPSTEGGQKTFPRGPIKWEDSADGKLTALAVGSEKGVARHMAVATLEIPEEREHDSLASGAYGGAVNRPNIFRTTTGIHTHPTDTGRDSSPEQPPSDFDPSPTSSRKNSLSPVSQRHLSVSSANARPPLTTQESTIASGAFATAPTTPFVEELPSHPSGQRELPDISGVSSVRYEQGSGTQAAGQSAEGAPSYLDQAKGLATDTYSSAYETVASMIPLRATSATATKSKFST